MTGYADFTVDQLPIFKKEDPIQLSFEDIQRNFLEDGSPLVPIKRRSGKTFEFEGTCPFCGAPKEYVYDNNGKGQFLCKVCKNPFTVKTTLSEEAGIYCPHYSDKLTLHHDREGYITKTIRNLSKKAKANI